MYILCGLREEVRKKRSEKWRTNDWFLLHYNAPAQQSALVKDFLAKKNVTTLELPTYSPDFTPADFYLFPVQKSAVKLRRFCDANDTIENATEELKRLSQDGFQQFFQHIYN
jgi:transposase